MRLVSLLVPVALLLCAPAAPAADEPPAEEVFRDNTAAVVVAAATLAGAGCQPGSGAALVPGLLIRGDQLHLWKIEVSDRAPTLSPGPLSQVKDSTGVRIGDRAEEVEAYCEALLKSSWVSPGAFANSARRDLSFAQVFGEPSRYRGQVIHFEGQLRRIRRFDPPGMVEPKGIRDLYECWLFDTHYGMNPVCLVCSELPPGVEPGEKLNLTASFDAYFFKKYRYKAADSKPDTAREAPLFIGRTFVLLGAPAASATEEAYATGSKAWLLLFLGVVLLTMVAVVLLQLWLRRGDRRVRDKIRAVRGGADVDPGATGPPGAAPSPN